MTIPPDIAAVSEGPEEQETVQVAIIGAGTSGLQTLRSVLRAGLEAVVLEARHDVGGRWLDMVALGQGSHPIGPWALWQLPGFSWPPTLKPHHQDTATALDMLRYTRDFADVFRLRSHVRCGLTVRALHQLPDGSWNVSCSETTAEGGVASSTVGLGQCVAGRSDRSMTLSAAFVVVACGSHGTPHIPHIPGRDIFRGLHLHAGRVPAAGRNNAIGGRLAAGGGNKGGVRDEGSLHGRPGPLTGLEGRRVVVVGGSRRAGELAGLGAVAAVSGSVIMLVDKVHLPLPPMVTCLGERQLLHTRTTAACAPPYYTATAMDRLFHTGLLWPLRAVYWRCLTAAARDETQPPDMQPGSLYDDLQYGGQGTDPVTPRLLRNPRVTFVQGKVAALDARCVVLSDGRHLPADVIVYCSGYTQRYPFLPLTALQLMATNGAQLRAPGPSFADPTTAITNTDIAFGPTTSCLPNSSPTSSSHHTQILKPRPHPPDLQLTAALTHDTSQPLDLLLYRRMVHCGLRNLAFVGCEVVSTNPLLTAGLQAEWLARLLCGQLLLPPASHMIRDMHLARQWALHQVEAKQRREVRAAATAAGAATTAMGRKTSCGLFFGCGLRGPTIESSSFMQRSQSQSLSTTGAAARSASGGAVACSATRAGRPLTHSPTQLTESSSTSSYGNIVLKARSGDVPTAEEGGGASLQQGDVRSGSLSVVAGGAANTSTAGTPPEADVSSRELGSNVRSQGCHHGQDESRRGAALDGGGRRGVGGEAGLGRRQMAAVEVLEAPLRVCATLGLHTQPYHDSLLHDMGLNPRRKGYLSMAECLLSYTARDYRHVLRGNLETPPTPAPAAASVRRSSAAGTQPCRAQGSQQPVLLHAAEVERAVGNELSRVHKVDGDRAVTQQPPQEDREISPPSLTPLPNSPFTTSTTATFLGYPQDATGSNPTPSTTHTSSLKTVTNATGATPLISTCASTAEAQRQAAGSGSVHKRPDGASSPFPSSSSSPSPATPLQPWTKLQPPSSLPEPLRCYTSNEGREGPRFIGTGSLTSSMPPSTAPAAGGDCRTPNLLTPARPEILSKDTRASLSDRPTAPDALPHLSRSDDSYSSARAASCSPPTKQQPIHQTKSNDSGRSPLAENVMKRTAMDSIVEVEREVAHVTDNKAACKAEPYCPVATVEKGAGWGPTDGLSEGLLHLLPPDHTGEAAAAIAAPVAGRSEYAKASAAGPAGLPSGSSPNCGLSGALCPVANDGARSSAGGPSTPPCLVPHLAIRPTGLLSTSAPFSERSSACSSPCAAQPLPSPSTNNRDQQPSSTDSPDGTKGVECCSPQPSVGAAGTMAGGASPQSPATDGVVPLRRHRPAHAALPPLRGAAAAGAPNDDADVVLMYRLRGYMPQTGRRVIHSGLQACWRQQARAHARKMLRQMRSSAAVAVDVSNAGASSSTLQQGSQPITRAKAGKGFVVSADAAGLLPSAGHVGLPHTLACDGGYLALPTVRYAGSGHITVQRPCGRTYSTLGGSPLQPLQGGESAWLVRDLEREALVVDAEVVGPITSGTCLQGVWKSTGSQTVVDSTGKDPDACLAGVGPAARTVSCIAALGVNNGKGSLGADGRGSAAMHQPCSPWPYSSEYMGVVLSPPSLPPSASLMSSQQGAGPPDSHAAAAAAACLRSAQSVHQECRQRAIGTGNQSPGPGVHRTQMCHLSGTSNCVSPIDVAVSGKSKAKLQLLLHSQSELAVETNASNWSLDHHPGCASAASSPGPAPSAAASNAQHIQAHRSFLHIESSGGLAARCGSSVGGGASPYESPPTPSSPARSLGRQQPHRACRLHQLDDMLTPGALAPRRLRSHSVLAPGGSASGGRRAAVGGVGAAEGTKGNGQGSPWGGDTKELQSEQDSRDEQGGKGEGESRKGMKHSVGVGVGSAAVQGQVPCVRSPAIQRQERQLERLVSDVTLKLRESLEDRQKLVGTP